MKLRLALWLALVALVFAPAARAEILGYYVGIDNQVTIPGTGTYSGLPNPHHNKLILLYTPEDFTVISGAHYHGKGRFVYTGPNLGAATAVVQNSAANLPINLPEGLPSLPLTPGSGIYANKIRSSYNPAVSQSLLTTNSVFDLTQQPGYTNPPSTLEGYFFHSSGNRYSSSLGDTSVSLELVSISPGLNIGTPTSLSAGFSGIGSSILLGTGNTWAADFDPVFWADDTVAFGTPLSATFRLVAGGTNTGAIGNSAQFTHNFSSAVPEPGTYALLACAGLAACCYWQRRRRLLAAA